MVPTASRMATMPMASTPHSQRQFCPVGPLGGALPSPFAGGLGRLEGLSVRGGVTLSMLGAAPVRR